MRTPIRFRSLLAPLFVLAGLAVPAASQVSGISTVRLIEMAADKEQPKGSGGIDLGPSGESAPGLPFDLEAEARDHVAAGIRNEASPVSRASLNSSSEATVPFSTAPGGIVLGLTARPAGSAGVNWQAAKLRFARPHELSLVAADGTAYGLPAIDARSLKSFLDFVSAGRSDTLIDIYGDNLNLAPAFADSPLARRLERADRAPRMALPDSVEKKSLMVDREVRFLPVAETKRIEFEADLEVRLYTKEDSWLLKGALHRTDTLPFLAEGRRLRPLGELPEGTRLEVLDPALADVARIAGWLGFLRWAQVQDPAGVRELRRALQAGKVSATQR